MKAIIKNSIFIINLIFTIILIGWLNSCVKQDFDPGNPPVLSSVEPYEVYHGDTVILRGGNLKSVVKVLLGNRKLDTTCFKYWNNKENEIIVIVPADADTGIVYVEVVNIAGYSRMPIHVKKRIIPRIVSVTPTTGMPGDTIHILGLDLYGVNKVIIGDKEANYVYINQNRIKAIIPSGITGGKGKVTILTNYGNPISDEEITIARFILITNHDGEGIQGISWSRYGDVLQEDVDTLKAAPPINNYVKLSTRTTGDLVNYGGIQLRANAENIPTRLGLTKVKGEGNKVELKIKLKADRPSQVQVLVAYGPNGTTDNYHADVTVSTKWTEYTFVLSDMHVGYGDDPQTEQTLINPSLLEWVKVAPQSGRYYSETGYFLDDPITVYVDDVYFVEYE